MQVDDPARRAVEHGCRWAIISGERPDADYSGVIVDYCWEQEHTYHNLNGMWEGVAESSFLIRNIGEQQARALARECKQDAFIYCDIYGKVYLSHTLDGAIIPAKGGRCRRDIVRPPKPDGYTETQLGFRFSFDF